MAGAQRFTDTSLRKLAKEIVDKPQKYFDGGGLYVLKKTGARIPYGSMVWIYKYQIDNKPRTYSIGPYSAVNLGEARIKHQAAKDMLANGIDPSAHKQEIKAQRKAEEQARKNTFKKSLWR